MKTVTGTIVSSKQVSVSKAASILSKFVSAETGASQAVNAYLRRAAAAADELARLHGKSDRRKHKNREPDAVAASARTATEEAQTRSAEASRGESTQGDTESKGSKKKQKKEKSSRFVNSGNDEGNMRIEVKDEQSNGEINLGEEIERKRHLKKEKMEIEGEIKLEAVTERKKHKKKSKMGIEVKEEQGHGESALGEESGRKKQKRKREKGNVVGDTDQNQGEIRDKDEGIAEKDDGFGRSENETQMEIGEKNVGRKKKKRKSREIEVDMGEGSEERPTKKKKKKRRSGEAYD